MAFMLLVQAQTQKGVSLLNVIDSPVKSIDFTADERPSDSPYIERVWRHHSEVGAAFTSIASIPWSIVVSKVQGHVILTVRGPEIRATSAFSPPDAEFFGIMFRPGTLMPLFPARMVMDRHDINLPGASSQSFWLNGGSWQYPDFENAETFVERLARDGMLLHDPLVGAVLEGQPVGTSLRTIQRRFLQATGMTQNTVSQIKRARLATSLLKKGLSILDVVDEAGYADQPHLTRSLKYYIGQTPAQITDENQRDPLSFLFKTHPY